MKRLLILLALLLPLVWTAGCSEQDQQEVGQAVEVLGQETEEAAVQAGEALDDASVTARVKSVLMTSARVDSDDIDVDTVERTVFLRGTAPTQEQVELAESLATSTLPKDFTVKNELTARDDLEKEQDAATR